jgi:RHS repeat-associated protein
VTAPVLSDGAATYTPGVSERRGSVTKYMHSGIKSADVQTNASQRIDSSRKYDAFGAVLSSNGTWSGPFGNAGKFGYQEDATGYQLLGHCYYDPSTGRFLTRDPIQDGRNWYTYCENDPVTFSDPEGLAVETGFDYFAFMLSLGQAINDPSFANITAAVLDGAALVVPGVPAVGGIVIRGGIAVKAGAAGVKKGGGKRAPKDIGTVGKPFSPGAKKEVKKRERKKNGTYSCAHCDMTVPESKIHIDHIIPISKGGHNGVSNGQVSCAHCNLSKGNGERPKSKPPGYKGDWPPPHWEMGPGRKR